MIRYKIYGYPPHGHSMHILGTCLVARIDGEPLNYNEAIKAAKDVRNLGCSRVSIRATYMTTQPAETTDKAKKL